MSNLSLGRRHLANAYEVEAGIGVIAGNTVWSMPERLECEVLQKARYINILTFTFTFYYLTIKRTWCFFILSLGWPELLAIYVLDWSQTLSRVSSSVRQLRLPRHRSSPSEQSSGTGCRRLGAAAVVVVQPRSSSRRAAASGDVTASVVENWKKPVRSNSDQIEAGTWRWQ